MVETPFRETIYKLSIEKCIIYIGDITAPPQTLRKDTLKRVHDEVYCDITATQRLLKLQALLLKYVEK